jgi:hypothetical protein
MTESNQYHIGFAIDGMVEQMIITDARIASIFLSNPEIVDLSDNPELSKHEEGFSWSISKNKWIPLRPYPSWIYDEESNKWNAPISIPDDGFWNWNEQKQKWVEAEDNDISLG